jgi:hypothetical protein
MRPANLGIEERCLFSFETPLLTVRRAATPARLEPSGDAIDDAHVDFGAVVPVMCPALLWLPDRIARLSPCAIAHTSCNPR